MGLKKNNSVLMKMDFFSKKGLGFGKIDSDEAVYQGVKRAGIFNSKICRWAHGIMKINLEEIKLPIQADFRGYHLPLIPLSGRSLFQTTHSDTHLDTVSSYRPSTHSPCCLLSFNMIPPVYTSIFLHIGS